jgi:hypothetical protein
MINLREGADAQKLGSFLCICLACRCSPRFLRKTRETLQREHRERITKQQYEPKEGPDNEHEDVKEDEEMLYTDNHQICVRPGCGARKTDEKLSKVSVAVDATPAARTDSILNQIPIELTRTRTSSEYLDLFEGGGAMLGASEYCEPSDFQSPEANEIHMVRAQINYPICFHHFLRLVKSPRTGDEFHFFLHLKFADSLDHPFI